MKIETIKKKGFAISLIAFPVMLLAGFIIHPNLLNNPDIELISAIGALLMCAGYIPWAIRILQGRMKCSSIACPIYDTKMINNFKCLRPCG